MRMDLQAGLYKPCLWSVRRSEAHMMPALLSALLKYVIKVLHVIRHALMLLKVAQHLIRCKIQWSRCSRNVKRSSWVGIIVLTSMHTA